MDAKITKTRLNRMLSYDWLGIVGAVAGAIIVWMLVFTMTATRIKSSQDFTVANYMGNISVTERLQNALETAHKEKVFSYEVIEYGTEDLVVAGDQASQVLQARTTTYELDVMLISTQADVKTSYEAEKEDGSKETAYRHTYLETFVRNYMYGLHNLDMSSDDNYFKNMENYLNEYFTEGYQNLDSLDGEKVEKAFRSRLRLKKDKRYKTEKQIQKAIEGEKERLCKYSVALSSFYTYLEQGYVSLTETQYIDETTGENVLPDKGVYSINLCPDVSKMGKLSEFTGYMTTYTDENGEEKTTVSAKDMQICLFDSNGKGEDFRYEGLVYVVDLIERVIALG